MGAASQVETVDSWWVMNRGASSGLFGDELTRAIERLATFPGSGAPFQSKVVPELKRVLLGRSHYHLYYTIHPIVSRQSRSPWGGIVDRWTHENESLAGVFRDEVMASLETITF